MNGSEYAVRAHDFDFDEASQVGLKLSLNQGLSSSGIIFPPEMTTGTSYAKPLGTMCSGTITAFGCRARSLSDATNRGSYMVCIS